MRKLLLPLFLFPFLLHAQTTTAFRKNYNYSLFDFPANIVEGLTANTYLLAGSGITTGVVSQLDDTGGVAWAYSYSVTINDLKKEASANQYFLCGNNGSNAAVLMVLDANGNMVVSSKFSISEADDASFLHVIKTSDGGYVAVGYVTGHDPDGGGAEIKFSPITYTDNNGDSQTDYIRSPLMVKFDASGNILWNKVFRYYTAATKDPATERIYNDASFADVVEVSDGYVAVGSYDVNQHRSATNSDGNDATPTDALIVKTTTAGAITYHKQVDNPDVSTSQASKYLSAVNTTSAGEIIAGGTDDSRELIQKFSGAGGFSNTFSRLFKYSTSFFGTVTDPSDVSQIYEVNGSADLVTMAMYIKPLSFFSNSIHRVNATATSNVFAKRYDFTGMFTIIPKGSQTSDGGYVCASMGAGGGADYDFHVIKTDNNGDTPTSGCPANSFSPSASAGPSAFADPFYNSWSGTNGSNSIAITSVAISLPAYFVCTKIECSVPAAATTVTASPSTICQNQFTTITASGPSTNVTYNVYATSTGGSSIGSTPLTVSPSSNITYYVETAQNADPACVSTSRTPVTITVNQNPAPSISASGSAEFCQGGSVTLTANSTESISNYSWSNTATSPGITVSTSGSFTVTVTYTNGCTNTSSPVTVTVNNNPTPIITASGATTFCEGGSVTLSTGAANFYNWSNGLTTQNITVTTTGNYSVTVTDGNNCTGSSGATTITVAQNPVPIISGQNAVCANAAATYSVTNTGNTFFWTVPNGIINTGQNSNSVSVTWSSQGAESISVTETNSSLCTGSATMNVTVSSSLNLAITASGDTNICEGDTVILDAGSGYSSYSWSNLATSQTIAVAAPGIYSVTVSDANGCTGSSSSPVTITVNSNPTPTITTSDSTTFCEGDSILLTASSATAYLWSTGDTTQTIYADSTGSYSVTVTDGNGCTGSTAQPANITVNSNPIVIITSDGSTTFCSGDSVALNAGSGYATYLWNTGDTTQTIFVDSSGNYSVSVTDSTGCSNDSSATSTSVTVNPNPVAAMAGNVPACSGDTLFLTASGGTSYLWSTGDTTSQIAILTSQIYGVTATDGNNCSAVDSAGVNFFPVFLVPSTQEICNGDSVFLQGGYQLSSGVYYDSLTSVNGCDSIIESTLTVNPVFITQNPQTICEGDTYTFNGNNYMVAGIYYDTLLSEKNCDSIIETNLMLKLKTGSTVNTSACGSYTLNAQTYTAGGTYTQVITNADDCDSTITLNLTILQSTSSTIDTTSCDTFSLNSQLYAAGGTYTQILTNAAGCDSTITLNLTLNFSDTSTLSAAICAGETYTFGLQTLTQTGNYSATFTKSNGCDSTVNLSLLVKPVFSFQTPDTICSNDSIFAQGNFQNTTGIYYDTLQSVNGCDSLVQTNLTVLPAPNPDSAGISPDSVTIFFRDTAHLTATATATFYWFPSEFLSCTGCLNPSANPDSTTMYYLTITAGNGCVLNDSVKVVVEYPPSDVFVPNIFSPNGDLQNDILYVYGRYVYRVEITIFDRWGEKIYYCNGTREECGWNGTYKGNILNNAVFVYYLKVTLFNQTEIIKKGNVTLVK